MAELLYGHPPQHIQNAKSEIRIILERRVRSARDRNDVVLYYSDLVKELETIHLHYHDALLGYLLGLVSSETDAELGVMLSVIVISHTNSISGPGFLQLARQLGRRERDDILLWEQEFVKVLQHYRGMP